MAAVALVITPALALALAPRPAAAQDDPDDQDEGAASQAPSASSAPAAADTGVAHVTDLNRDAVAAMEAKDWPRARDLLKEALDACDAEPLRKHPIAARTHIHMGIVLIAGFKQRELGLRQFKKAVEIQPGITLTKSVSTPEAQQAFEQAARPTLATAGEAPDVPELPSKGIIHNPWTRAKRGQPLEVTVGLADDVDYERLVLAYRPDGARDFIKVPLRQDEGGGPFKADIPADAMGGKRVAYYVAAVDEYGVPLAQKGSPKIPMIVAISKTGKTDHDRDDDDDDADPDADLVAGGSGALAQGNLFLGLSVGMGAGWATGTGDLNADSEVSSGFALAQLGHLAPAIGYRVSPDLVLSLVGRFQKIVGQTDLVAGDRTYHAANYAAAGFLKATWLFGDGDARLRPFASAAVGGGRIRHVVKFPELNDCGATQKDMCVDTVGAGPFLAGLGGGVAYGLGDALALVAGVDSQVGAPSFTINFDANLGVAMTF